ncbi:uncharacterized protein LOC5520745 [Nematostella vectensis]|uniref:uncharacterized protein LOC5520745 n=1 Tax=Nematostella vectensis TaxID=45351 RepID=UPI0013900E2E|nr:uncharacterized protein LOC5520745 [Nematostella vectensis]XP_048585899.1 uncharacterized protein LOC5520745 [Nematostella vectensis]
MASTEVEGALDDLDNIAADSPEECAIDDENQVMERCNFMPENKNIEDVKDMDEYVLSYFESLNSMSRRIIAEQREVIQENKGKWERLSPEEQDKLIDDRLVDPRIRRKYGEDSYFRTKPEWFPVLKLAHGLSDSEGNAINFAPNPRDSIASVTLTDLHSKDQFSSPWCWASRSQEDLRILEEGELEERLKKVTESEPEEIPKGPPLLEMFSRKKHIDFEALSKDSSPSGSAPGSDLFRRRDFLEVDMDTDGGSKGSSVGSSTKGSKASLNSSDNSSEHATAKDENDEVDGPKAVEEIQSSTTQDMMAFLQNW